jgi:hypothetical protein
MTAASKAFFKWWVVISFIVLVALGAIGEFGSLDKRVTTVEADFKAHKEQQTKQREEDRENIQYIRDRIDRALDQQARPRGK